MSDRDLLDALEARVLGVLIEKELTTPDHYPLTLNALTAGCNQKSNRDPAMSLGESEVRSAFERLRQRQLAGGVQGSGARVPRFRHNARETWGVSAAGAAILAELLLRGAQGPGELRSRASRMVTIPTLGDLDAHLDELLARGYVMRLEPLPGSRARRYDQLLAQRQRLPGAARQAGGSAQPPLPVLREEAPAEGEERGPGERPDAPARAVGAAPGETDGGRLEARVASLESEVRFLRQSLARLAEALGEEL